jgi:hypothetical protein
MPCSRSYGRSRLQPGRALTASSPNGGGALLSDAKQARDDRASRRASGVSRNRELAAERRARSIDATTAAIEALGGLRDLETKPDWTQERDSYAGKERRALSPDEQALVDGWEARRDGL